MAYHINDKGETGRCSAKRSCPFGLPIEKHFATPEQARTAYEASRSASILVSHVGRKKSRTSEVTPPLTNVLDPAELVSMIEQGYVGASPHPKDDSLRILCYSKTAQAEGKWNDVTKATRGLVVQTSRSDYADAVVIQRPFAKFYTLQQMNTGWHLGDDEDESSAGAADDALGNIDFSAPASVTDKLDGSMMILYRDPSGRPAVASKGSFKSDVANYYSKKLAKDEKALTAAEELLNNHQDTTFLFEGIGSIEHQVVLSYERDELSMIGAVVKSNGLMVPTSAYRDTWSEARGLSVAESMNARTLDEALALPDRADREGVVVLMNAGDPGKQMMVKIKQDDYLALHRKRTNFSKSELRTMLFEANPTYRELFAAAESGDVTGLSDDLNERLTDDGITPGTQAELFHNRRVELIEQSALFHARRTKNAYDEIAAMPDSQFAGNEAVVRKGFFTAVQEREVDAEYRGMLLRFFSNRLNGVDVLDRSASREMKTASALLRGNESND